MGIDLKGDWVYNIGVFIRGYYRIMKKSLFKKACDLLSGKLLVVPQYTRIVENKKETFYQANAIHRLAEDDLYFPESRKLRLFMPLSATENKDIRLTKTLPEQIKIVDEDENEKQFFALTPVSSKKTVDKLDYFEKEYFGEMFDLKKEKKGLSFVIPMQFKVHLPMVNRNKILTQETVYPELVENFARDLYNTFALSYKNMLRKDLKGKARDKFQMSEEQEKEMNHQFVKFVKTFDAMEVGYTTTPYVCSFVGCDGFDRTLDYATYDVLLYRFPTTSDFYCAVKNNVMKQVEERKAEVAAKTASTTVVK